MIIKFLNILGVILLVAAVLFIVGNAGLIVWFNGWGRLQEVFSPFNIWNNIMVLVVVAPGAFCMWLAAKLARRRSAKTPTK